MYRARRKNILSITIWHLLSSIIRTLKLNLLYKLGISNCFLLHVQDSSLTITANHEEKEKSRPAKIIHTHIHISFHILTLLIFFSSEATLRNMATLLKS
ncbi:hypothetical protein RJT34_01858 [Clitoria ternatea]|uniref:Uncharacterized protein n=1 Tax=Clitoria ternatea TaxID=43366 RepID=A0AAN9KJT8_CLITE